MASSVDLIQRFFTSLETRADRIVLGPDWPESLGVLAFPIHYRGHRLHLRVSGKSVDISADPRESPPVEIECRGHVQRLLPGRTVRFPHYRTVDAMTRIVRAGRTTAAPARVVGLAAVVFSGLYLLSDVIETVQGGFSGPQLTLTLIGEAAIPFIVGGLYIVQRPQSGRLGLISAIAYAYSYVFFTGTVVYAIVNVTSDYSALTGKLGALMTVHGAIMVFAGIGFGLAVIRAGVLPRWTGPAASSRAAPSGLSATRRSPRAVSASAPTVSAVILSTSCYAGGSELRVGQQSKTTRAGTVPARTSGSTR